MVLLTELTTPEQWYKDTVGKLYDMDNFPSYNKYQCWDYFCYFTKCGHMNVNTYCNKTGYAGDLWKERYQKNYAKYFTFHTDINDVRDGDWLFYDRHVAMYYHGKELGQNQKTGDPAVRLINLNKNILGFMRYKYWNQPKGIAEIYDKKLAGIYKTSAPLNIRTGGSTKYPSLYVLNKLTTVRCYGYAHNEDGTIWLYVLAYPEGQSITGFVCSDYLIRED